MTKYLVLVLFVTFEYVVGDQMIKGIIQARILSSGVQCIQENPLSLKDIQVFRKKMLPEGETAKCFAACLFKKIGIMDDMGKLSSMGAKEKAQQVFNNDEASVMKVTEIIETCASVNEMPVSDGNKGCDRAKLAFSCLVDNSSKLGFELSF